MYGLIDDLVADREEIKALKGKLFDLKTLTQLLLERPNDETVKQAVRIAIKNLE